MPPVPQQPSLLLDAAKMDARSATQDSKSTTSSHPPRKPLSLEEFHRTHPLSDLSTLSAAELEERLTWNFQIHSRLASTVEALEHTFQAEWAAKELALTKVLQKDIDPPIP